MSVLFGFRPRKLFSSEENQVPIAMKRNHPRIPRLFESPLNIPPQIVEEP